MSDKEVKQYICSHANDCFHETCIHKIPHKENKTCYVTSCWYKGLFGTRKCLKVKVSR